MIQDIADPYSQLCSVYSLKITCESGVETRIRHVQKLMTTGNMTTLSYYLDLKISRLLWTDSRVAGAMERRDGS